MMIADQFADERLHSYLSKWWSHVLEKLTSSTISIDSDNAIYEDARSVSADMCLCGCLNDFFSYFVLDDNDNTRKVINFVTILVNHIDYVLKHEISVKGLF